MVGSVYGFTIRTCGVLGCCLLFFFTWRVATADYLATSSRSEDIEAAIGLDPENPTYRFQQAVHHLYGIPADPRKARLEFEEALKQNPLNAQALMQLGLLAETRGLKQEAETFLTRAVAVDHTFQPLWTLANFHFRTLQLKNMSEEIREALAIATNPRFPFFDPAVIYDLCWAAGMDSRQLLKLVPNQPPALLSYFVYLISHGHAGPAYDLYPTVLPFADPSVQLHRSAFSDLCSFLLQSNRINDAVQVWNQLVEKRLILSTTIDSSSGAIANPRFEFPFDAPPFGWLVVSAIISPRSWTPYSISFDLDGNQPEQLVLLEKKFPVEAGRKYILTWNTDGTRITRPSDPLSSGLSLSLEGSGAAIDAICSPFLDPSGKDRSCVFSAPHNTELMTLRLLCKRLAGNVRLRGSLRISKLLLAASN